MREDRADLGYITHRRVEDEKDLEEAQNEMNVTLSIVSYDGEQGDLDTHDCDFQSEGVQGWNITQATTAKSDNGILL